MPEDNDKMSLQARHSLLGHSVKHVLFSVKYKTFCLILIIREGLVKIKKKNYLHGLSPRANYTDRATRRLSAK
jgi:hypothetical protein